MVSNKEKNKGINKDINKKDIRNSITSKKENGDKKNFRLGTNKHKLKIDYS